MCIYDDYANGTYNLGGKINRCSIYQLKDYTFLRLCLADKIKYVKSGRPMPDLTQTSASKKFDVTLYKTYTWLTGCLSKCNLFCWPCLLFNTHPLNKWTSTGINQALWNIDIAIQCHLKDKEHIIAAKNLTAFELYIKNMSTTPAPVTTISHIFNYDDDNIDIKEEKMTDYIETEFDRNDSNLLNQTYIKQESTSTNQPPIMNPISNPSITVMIVNSPVSVIQQILNMPRCEYAPVLEHISDNICSLEMPTEKVKLFVAGRHKPKLPQLIANSSSNNEIDLYEKIPWLTACEITNKFYCWPCLFFNSQAIPFNTIGYNLSQLLMQIKYHTNDDYHIKAAKLIEDFSTMLKLGKIVDVPQQQEEDKPADNDMQMIVSQDNCVWLPESQLAMEEETTDMLSEEYCIPEEESIEPELKFVIPKEECVLDDEDASKYNTLERDSMPDEFKYVQLEENILSKECEEPMKETSVIQQLIKTPFQSNMPTEKLLEIIVKGRPTPELHLKDPTIKKCSVLFDTINYENIYWLAGCSKTNKLYCWSCLLFCEEKCIWNNEGFVEVSDIYSHSVQHSNSINHVIAANELLQCVKNCSMYKNTFNSSDKYNITLVMKKLGIDNANYMIKNQATQSNSKTKTSLESKPGTSRVAASVSIEKLLSLPRSRLTTKKQHMLNLGRPTPGLPILKVSSNEYFSHKYYYNKFKWLTGSCKLYKLYCWPCIFFNKEQNIWNKDGCNYNVLSNINKHEKDCNHMLAVTKLNEYHKSHKKITKKKKKN